MATKDLAVRTLISDITLKNGKIERSFDNHISLALRLEVDRHSLKYLKENVVDDVKAHVNEHLGTFINLHVLEDNLYLDAFGRITKKETEDELDVLLRVLAHDEYKVKLPYDEALRAVDEESQDDLWDVMQEYLFRMCIRGGSDTDEFRRLLSELKEGRFRRSATNPGELDPELRQARENREAVLKYEGLELKLSKGTLLTFKRKEAILSGKHLPFGISYENFKKTFYKVYDPGKHNLEQLIDNSKYLDAKEVQWSELLTMKKSSSGRLVVVRDGVIEVSGFTDQASSLIDISKVKVKEIVQILNEVYDEADKIRVGEQLNPVNLAHRMSQRRKAFTHMDKIIALSAAIGTELGFKEIGHLVFAALLHEGEDLLLGDYRTAGRERAELEVGSLKSLGKRAEWADYVIERFEARRDLLESAVYHGEKYAEEGEQKLSQSIRYGVLAHPQYHKRIDGKPFPFGGRAMNKEEVGELSTIPNILNFANLYSLLKGKDYEYRMELMDPNGEHNKGRFNPEVIEAFRKIAYKR